MVRGGDEVGTSINFNFSAWYEVEIRFSDNPRQGDNRRHHSGSGE